MSEAFNVSNYSPDTQIQVKIECDAHLPLPPSEASKVLLKDALVYCEKVLLDSNLIASESSAVLSAEGILLGEKIYRKIMEILAENEIVMKDVTVTLMQNGIDDDEVIMVDEPDEEGLFEEVKALAPSNSRSEDEYDPEDEEERSKVDYVPLDYKEKVVNLAKEHPKWSLKTLQTKGASRLKNMKQLKRWEDQVKTRGTKLDKYKTIDSLTYDRFKKARESGQRVTSSILQQWALSAARDFPDLDFKASKSWVEEFKRRHGIRTKKINAEV